MKLKWRMTAVTMLLGVFIFSHTAFAKTLIVKGSNAMLDMGKKMGERYSKDRPDITIQWTGGGSGVGIAALLNITVDLAAVSRPMKEKELNKAKTAGLSPTGVAVARDALAIVVNQSNPVQTLSVSQVEGILTGRITRWNEVGGPDNAITCYVRESGSIAYRFVKENILKDHDSSPDSKTVQSDNEMVDAVNGDPNGIGYANVTFLKNDSRLKVLAIKKEDASSAVSPLKSDHSLNFGAILSDQYPIVRSLYLYTALQNAEPDVKTFLEWTLEPEGQKIVKESGFISVKG